MSEDIKVGETYYVRVKVLHKNEAIIGCATVDNEGKNLVEFMAKEGPAFIPASKLTPKYDPCRLFREGDKAKPRIINGREIPKMPLDVIFTVTGDEDEYGAVPVEYLSPVRGLLTSTTVHAVWLELVTPVEELEPYSVVDAHTHWDVADKNMKTVATYSKGNHPNAKAAAEAERDRLNAEWRKEQNHDR